MAIVGWGSPGPNAQSFQDAYVQKVPTALSQTIRPSIAQESSLILKARGASNSSSIAVESDSGNRLIQFVANDQTNDAVRLIFTSLAGDPYSKLMIMTGQQGGFDPAIGYDEVSGAAWLILGQPDVLGGIFPNRLALSGSTIANGGGLFLDPLNALDWQAAGAQVGLPTGALGAQGTVAFGAHRHAFSGRFSVSGFKAAGVLVGNPVKFKRFKFLNAFTVRRISIYALTAPVGNGETWGIVNAAGATQGTAVALNGGVLENEAAQTTNLLGNTAYYLAQIGVAGTTPSADVNLEVEYTMNV